MCDHQVGEVCDHQVGEVCDQGQVVFGRADGEQQRQGVARRRAAGRSDVQEVGLPAAEGPVGQHGALLPGLLLRPLARLRRHSLEHVHIQGV